MLLTSLVINKISFVNFLKTKTPEIPAGKYLSWSLSALYPRRLRAFLSTASLATLFGTIKDTFFCEDSLLITNLKLKVGELMNFPCLKIRSTSFLPARLFLGSIIARARR